jgi:hypothetical protein
MSRLVATAVLFALWTGVAAAGDVAPRQSVDLDTPGALEALQRSNQIHFDKVRQIMSGVAQQADADVSDWMLMNFNARAVRYAPNEVSYPKRHLWFVLDDTLYSVTP